MITDNALVDYATTRKLRFYSTAVDVLESGAGGLLNAGEGEQVYVTSNGELLVADVSSAALHSTVSQLRYLRDGGYPGIQIAVTTPDILERLRLSAVRAASEIRVPSADQLAGHDTSMSLNERRVISLIKDALQRRASDIAFVAQKETGKVTISHRIDGQIVFVDEREYDLTYEAFMAMAAVMTNYMAVRKGGDRESPFDENEKVSATFSPEGLDCRVRYHHMPSAEPRGLSVSLRLTAASSGKVSSLSQLGYSAAEVRHILPNFSLSHGLVLFTGPTGAGKTSMMAAGLITIPDSRRVLTLEDPVEIPIPNAIQFSVTSTSGGFDVASKSLLRMDPDVVAVGEIRDFPTLDSAIKNASTGHLVLSTLHTNGTLQTISRMYDMGGSPNRLATPSLIRAIFANRLVPALCQTCSTPFLDAANDPHLRARSTFRAALAFFKRNAENASQLSKVRVATPRGDCPTCRGSGFRGRLPVVEILIVDDEGRKFIQASDLVGYETYLRSRGWKRLADRAVELIYEGRVCPLGAETYIDGIYGQTDRYDYNVEAEEDDSVIDRWLKEVSRSGQAEFLVTTDDDSQGKTAAMDHLRVQSKGAPEVDKVLHHVSEIERTEVAYVE